tara:strand:- start:7200 stop:9134 length:1935 start_codon:yes stop_codon:yes gene_type:complete
MESKYYIEKTAPNCLSSTNGSITIKIALDQNLSFNWLNIPKTANVSNNGAAVYNLPCGVYFLEIYDLETEETENVEVSLSCDSVLTLDFTKIEGLHCYGNTGVLQIGWSGGNPPYFLSINSNKYTTYDNNYSVDIKNNIQYNLIIKDSYNCIIQKNNIMKYLDPLNISVNWSSIDYHDRLCKKINCNITGGKPPYKIAWFEENNDKPIFVNVKEINNKLKGGTYKILVKDDNECTVEKQFHITNPSPIKVNIKHSADYASNQPHTLTTLPKVNNLVLINKKNISDLFMNKLQNIKLQHDGPSIDQRICMDYGDVSIGNQKYYYFYITPGLDSTKNKSSIMTIDNKEFIVEHNTVFNSSNKLICGSLFIRNDQSYAIQNDVKLELSSNENTMEAICSKFYVSKGLYLSFDILSYVNFISSSKSNNYNKILKFINTYSDISVESNYNILNKHGEIYCSVYNIDPDSCRAELIDSNNKKTLHNISNNQLSIKNLVSGDYKLRILDDYNIAKNYNNNEIDSDYYNLKIAQSFDEEQKLCKIINAQKYDINANLLNKYDHHLSKKILFTSPKYQNGVLINVCPLDSCYKIKDAHGKIILKDCGYKIISLDFGHYFIDFFKEGYITKSQEFFHNNKKTLVTTILDKEPHV